MESLRVNLTDLKWLPNNSRRNFIMKINYKKGISLIEMTVTAGLFVVISGLLIVMIVRSYNSYRYSRQTIDAQEKASVAMRDFEKNTRGATQILNSSPNELIFYSYLLDDRQPAPSRVRYYVENGNLAKGVIHADGTGPIFDYPTDQEFYKIIAKNVINGDNLFLYYNDASVQIGDPVPADAVRMIKFTISIDKNTANPPEAITEITSVNLRNLKTNL